MRLTEDRYFVDEWGYVGTYKKVLKPWIADLITGLTMVGGIVVIFILAIMFN